MAKKKKNKGKKAKSEMTSPDASTSQAQAASSTNLQTSTKTPRVVSDWENYMGEGELEDWQRLMRDLGFNDHFPSKNQCKKALKTVWVNIVDFLEDVRNGDRTHRFPSRNALKHYTLKERKLYPKKYVDKKSPLRQLLATLFHH